MRRCSRAVVSALSCVAAMVVATADGVTIDYATVGNPGNAAASNGWGAVSEVFAISKYETTNAQYAEFLNRVDPAGTNPNGVYSPLMGSDSLGGIAFSTAFPAGSKYVLKSGAPPGSPPGTGYATMPVEFVTWFSAARFANWLQNGQQASAVSMESGSYLLANRTSGAIVERSPGAGQRVVIPSRDEWYKAAFFNGRGYTSYPCDSNSPLVNTVTDLSAHCAANFGASATPTVGPINVGSYLDSSSASGLYDTFGNVTEYTDMAGTLADAGKVQVFGGSWATALEDAALWSSTAPPVFRSSTTATGQVGFRVAVVQAVPEPTMPPGFAVALGGLAAWWRRVAGRQPPTETFAAGAGIASST
ncbi:MAG: formylglycine-generating enzyme family protein [Planctomycetaceae bacterium]